METQWNFASVGGGMGAIDAMRTGLCYAGVQALVDQRFKRRKRHEAFWLVQAMEEAALEEYRVLAALRGKSR